MRAVLDGREAVTCEALHRLLQSALGFPDYYGKNLDALYDCLTDLPPGTELTIRHFDALRENFGEVYTGKLIKTLDAAAETGFSWAGE